MADQLVWTPRPRAPVQTHGRVRPWSRTAQPAVHVVGAGLGRSGSPARSRAAGGRCLQIQAGGRQRDGSVRTVVAPLECDLSRSRWDFSFTWAGPASGFLCSVAIVKTAEWAAVFDLERRSTKICPNRGRRVCKRGAAERPGPLSERGRFSITPRRRCVSPSCFWGGSAASPGWNPPRGAVVRGRRFRSRPRGVPRPDRGPSPPPTERPRPLHPPPPLQRGVGARCSNPLGWFVPPLPRSRT